MEWWVPVNCVESRDTEDFAACTAIDSVEGAIGGGISVGFSRGMSCYGNQVNREKWNKNPNWKEFAHLTTIPMGEYEFGLHKNHYFDY
ncbi:MAG: hypothetical protein H0Z30_07810 [Candidatus Marinimicrobia bacterium]|nr:hypothetical protein [Candidatus Neomarinimicrobiota bacterium]